MISEYGGVLGEREPLYSFLADHIYGEVLELGVEQPIFDFFHLDHSNTVVRYLDRVSGVSVVGKFYGNKWIDGRQSGEPERRAHLMRQEYEKLLQIRALGFSDYPRRVVRPLATARHLNCLLVEEWAPGHDLDVAVREAVEKGRRDALLRRVADVATFLAELHDRTRSETRVDPRRATGYLQKVTGQLLRWGVISPTRADRLEALARSWGAYGILEVGHRVTTHGDPIPPHFLFESNLGMSCIDVERLTAADAAADVGCVVAELKHLFYLYTGDRWASEPFLRQVYATYISKLPSGTEDPLVLTARGRFFMGCYLLRIARNDWLELGYRRALIEEAELCLRL